MIRALLDFALNNRFVVLDLVLVLFAGRIVSFKRLPVEANPDVANTWVQVITQWPRGGRRFKYFRPRTWAQNALIPSRFSSKRSSGHQTTDERGSVGRYPAEAGAQK